MSYEWTRLTTPCWLIQTIGDIPPGEDWLAAAERETLTSLRSPKRRCDWSLGRWTAKQALVGLLAGVVDSPADVLVAADSRGVPYPRVNGRAIPWRISISHSHDRGFCVVGPADTAVGCDLERVEPRSDDFTREWFTPSEQETIARAPTGERALIVTLLWSAKESALKALGAGLTISTHDVRVSLGDPDSDRPWSGLSVQSAGDLLPMRGWWRGDGRDVMTVVTAPALHHPIPVSN